MYVEDGNVTSRQADISTSEIKITINSRPLRVSGPDARNANYCMPPKLPAASLN
jgi:hypothetical protein